MLHPRKDGWMRGLVIVDFCQSEAHLLKLCWHKLFAVVCHRVLGEILSSRKSERFTTGSIYGVAVFVMQLTGSRKTFIFQSASTVSLMFDTTEMKTVYCDCCYFNPGFANETPSGFLEIDGHCC